MAVLTNSWMSAPTIATDAEFRKWAKGIGDALIASGMVQSNDTGQADYTTAVTPTSIGHIYQIFRFNDALQATAPVFVKVLCGNVGGKPSLRVGVSSDTDGAGELIGNNYFSETYLGNTSISSTSAEYVSYASGDGSSASVLLWPGQNGNYSLGGFSIGRSCDTFGAYNGDALVISLFGIDQEWQVVAINGSDPYASCAKTTYAPVVLPGVINNVQVSTASTLSGDGTTAPVMPLPCVAPGVTPWVPNHLVAIHPGDAGATSVIQVVTINGESRKFRAMTVMGSNTQSGVVLVPTAAGAVYKAFPAIAWA